MTIEKTIGSGGDYGLLSTAIATLFYATDPGEDIVFDLISSINDDISGPNILKLFNRSVTIKCSYNELHKENKSEWYFINQTNPAYIYSEYWANTYGFTLNFSYLKFKFDTLASSFTHYIHGYLQPGTPFDQLIYINVSNCIFHNISPTYYHNIIETGEINVITKVFNCLFYDANSAILLNGDYFGNQNIIENCSAYGGIYGIKKGGGSTWANTTIKNFTISEAGTIDCEGGLSGAIIKNCADSDGSIALSGATFSYCITDISDDDYVSTDPSANDFLGIDPSSALYEKGTSDISEWNTEDIDGSPRPHGDYNMVSIGAYEGIYSIPDGDFYSTDHSVVINKGLVQSWTKTASERIPIMKLLEAHTANRSNPHQVGLGQLYPGTLPAYADNTAALAGGLIAGQLYRNGDFVCVVH